jgi:hypothetical protein
VRTHRGNFVRPRASRVNDDWSAHGAVAYLDRPHPLASLHFLDSVSDDQLDSGGSGAAQEALMKRVDIDVGRVAVQRGVSDVALA